MKDVKLNKDGSISQRYLNAIEKENYNFAIQTLIDNSDYTQSDLSRYRLTMEEYLILSEDENGNIQFSVG